MHRKDTPRSRTSSIQSENELQTALPKDLQDPSKVPKTISMSELNQLKPPVGVSYVLLTDAEVQESLKAVEGDQEKKSSSTWQEIEIQRRLELDNRKERRKHEHGEVGELHSK